MATKQINHDSTHKEILEKCRAGYPALYLVSSEYVRAMSEIKKAATDSKRALFVWTVGKGIAKDGTDKLISDTDSPVAAMNEMLKLPPKSIIILLLFHHFLEDPQIQSQLINLTTEFKSSGRTLIVLTPSIKLPIEVEKEFALIDLRLPDEKELEETLNDIIHSTGLKGADLPNSTIKKALVENARGLTTAEAENAFSLAKVRPKMEGHDHDWDAGVVLEEKCSTLKKSGLLTYYPPGKEGLKQIGGMANLKEWISKRRRAFTEEAKKFGLPSPKGILMVGPPGSGKSLGAKAISEELGLPLLRCDMGRIFAGLVGASEENSRRVIQTAEAIAPCVLWLDEIEKGFAGSGSGGNLDSGVGARVLGTFLTWMQEKQTPVFVYATANNVAMLPPELLRKGRFDDTFSVMLPNDKERAEIFNIHLNKRGRAKVVPNLNIPSLVVDTKDWSGAEIEAAINEAMFNAFSHNRELAQEDLQLSIDVTTPLSKMMREQIEAMVKWCEGRTRPANEVIKHVSTPAKLGRTVEA